MVHVPAQKARGTSDLFDVHLSMDSAGGINGKIVVTEGLAMPTTVRRLEQEGAKALIFIHPGKNIHEGICTTIWGTPTSENIHRKPESIVACINRPDGDRRLGLLEKGSATAHVSTELEEGWKKCPLPVATIQGGDPTAPSCENR